MGHGQGEKSWDTERDRTEVPEDFLWIVVVLVGFSKINIMDPCLSAYFLCYVRQNLRRWLALHNVMEYYYVCVRMSAKDKRICINGTRWP